jgi:mevalonate kinase
VNSISFEIPAKVMLAGEYSILDGSPSLASSLDLFYTVKVQYNTEPDQPHTIISDLWDEPLEIATSCFDLTGPHQEIAVDYLATAIRCFPLNSTITITIDSGWAVSDGLGSSSAIGIGIIAGCKALSTQSLSLESPEILDLARDVQRARQPRSSGYDLMTQLHGGMISIHLDLSKDQLRMTPCAAPTKEWLNKHLHLYVGGQGAPTSETMQSTAQWLEKKNRNNVLKNLNQSLISALLNPMNSIETIVKEFIQFQNFWKTSPKFPHKIWNALDQITGYGQSWAAKTTGAGGEDAILVISKTPLDLNNLGLRRLDVTFGNNRTCSTNNTPLGSPGSHLVNSRNEHDL